MRSTADPVATTSASASWPITRWSSPGGGVPYSNVQISQSVPQMPTSRIRSRTWSGEEITGSFCSITLTWRDPGNTETAFMFSSGNDRSCGAGSVHFVGVDQVDDRVDERQMGEGLREVPEVPSGMRVDLLGVQQQRACVGEQLLAQCPGAGYLPDLG